MHDVADKDEILYDLSRRGNVARFSSFDAGLPLTIRFTAIDDCHEIAPTTPPDVVRRLLKYSGSINIRTFRSDCVGGGPFVYGVTSEADALAKVESFAADGWRTICNETVDIHDGGVSGVLLDDRIEFAPDDTPRCVEREGTCRLSRRVGTRLLQTVYGSHLEFPDSKARRIEFSIHPLRRGMRNEHLLVWEESRTDVADSPSVIPAWPNRFSEMLGDKVFGLLIAWSLKCRVPQTTVISRRVAPFTFGYKTTTGEVWHRTAPGRPIPGYLPSGLGWIDPFELMRSFPDHALAQCASVLSQAAVEPAYSGAAAFAQRGRSVVEGVPGRGDGFMLGREASSALPLAIREAVESEASRLGELLGPVQFEWVHDGQQLWIVQLHQRGFSTGGDVFVPGEAAEWIDFPVVEGLEALRALVAEVKGKDVGIRFLGDVGVTSHFGDVVRAARIPTLIVRKD